MSSRARSVEPCGAYPHAVGQGRAPVGEGYVRRAVVGLARRNLIPLQGGEGRGRRRRDCELRRQRPAPLQGVVGVREPRRERDGVCPRVGSYRRFVPVEDEAHGVSVQDVRLVERRECDGAEAGGAVVGAGGDGGRAGNLEGLGRDADVEVLAGLGVVVLLVCNHGQDVLPDLRASGLYQVVLVLFPIVGESLPTVFRWRAYCFVESLAVFNLRVWERDCEVTLHDCSAVLTIAERLFPSLRVFQPIQAFVLGRQLVPQ